MVSPSTRSHYLSEVQVPVLEQRAQMKRLLPVGHSLVLGSLDWQTLRQAAGLEAEDD